MLGLRIFGLYAALLWVTAATAIAQRMVGPQTNASKTRMYYVAAEEVDWNYAPNGRNLAGLPRPENEESAGGTANTTTYRKAIYREYTDATFTTLKRRDARWEHLGILGPLIRAEVGDTIRVVLKNKTAIMCSMHPHGLRYAKDSEGAVYAGSTGAKTGVVKPGATYVYTWEVPERAGPAHGDGSSVLWMYHGHFLEDRDINSGLIGPILINAKGMSKPDGTPSDVDREFITAFAVFDESDSWYFEANMARQKRPPAIINRNDPSTIAPFLVYTINGLIEGNLPVMTMKKGEHVRWYMFASSNDDDVHTPHWHGESVLANHMRTDVVQLTPMGMATADMIADNPGTWLFHCHNNEHLEGGMVAMFKVLP
jgi:FtsP/CotA-like multicopper oxidase with cupredoxin domain